MTQTSLDMLDASLMLQAAYQELGYSGADGLLDARKSPGGLSEEVWVDKGDWLVAAHNAQVSKVFFLENNPVAVFLQEESTDPETHRQRFNRAWSLARPRLLFLARPGELAIYDLAQSPPRSGQDFKEIEPLALAQRAADVAERMQAFRRQSLESGQVFKAERRFGDLKNRADKALIRDLKRVREQLIELGLRGEKLRFAHSLIGRSIFVRYLEDRGILTAKAFEEIVHNRKDWRELLANPPSRPGLDLSSKPSLFARALGDKCLTYELFRKLAKDLNGDMFPDMATEENVVTQEHLRLIQSLLFGDTTSQTSLFFYAYDFEIIPIDLISSIYEEFYHNKSLDHKVHGAHFTPSVLVEFLVEQVLTPERLASSPKILDLSCGSGIFLVEAFRRIVRHRTVRQGRRLRFDELKKILREQLRGIDVNAEAIRVAAFSLYLALLHYVERPDVHEQIRRGNRLPKLIANGDSDSFNMLLAANAFDEEKLQALRPTRFDIVLGNPPWGSPGTKDLEARQVNQIAVDWCERRALPIGDRERSQAFIWRTTTLLAPNGIAALLVSSGVLLKHHKNSVEFRRRWLEQCRLKTVFNFIHPRKSFFQSGTAPFIGVIFEESIRPQPQVYWVQYWSARRTRLIEDLQSIVFSTYDGKLLGPQDDLTDYRTWKVYWWGNHRDKNLVLGLGDRFPKLADSVSRESCGQGYTPTGNVDAVKLKKYKMLPVKYLERYGKLDTGKFEEPPSQVWRLGNEEVYSGRRVLVRRGILQKGVEKGRIVARLDESPFCFTNNINGVKLLGPGRWRYQVVLGIFWSSLARYFYFVTGSSWGVWHHELHLDDEILSLPICFPEDGPLKDRLLRIVEELQNLELSNISVERIRILENDLDDAIFELYSLGEAEIDLIRDLCDIQLDFFYSGDESAAAQPVEVHDIKEYCRTLDHAWSRYLEDGTQLRWRYHKSPQDHSMLAMVFTVHGKGDDHPPANADGWTEVLRRLDKTLLYPVSSRIYLEGMVRATTRDSIIVVKRNEKRFWTRSMAREDAEATLAQAMSRDSKA